jgi:hypothetical protein
MIIASLSDERDARALRCEIRVESRESEGEGRVDGLHRVYVLYVDFTNINHTLLIVGANCMQTTCNTRTDKEGKDRAIIYNIIQLDSKLLVILHPMANELKSFKAFRYKRG